MLKKLCETLQSVFNTKGDEEDFSDLQKAYGLLLSVSKIDGTHVPEQVRVTLSSGSIYNIASAILRQLRDALSHSVLA